MAERLEIIKNENKKLKESLKQKDKELSFFIEVGKALTSTLEFKEILKIIMDNAQKLVRSEAWSILLVDEKTNELLLYYGAADTVVALAIANLNDVLEYLKKCTEY